MTVVYDRDFETLVFDGAANIYYGFPGLVELDDGTIFIVCMRATDHATTRDGKIVGKKSTDGGVTFGAETTILDTANDLRDPDLVKLSNGKVLLTYTEWTLGVEVAHSMLSTDATATAWDSPVTISSNLNLWSFACGRAIEIPNGDLLVGLYGRIIGDTLDRAVCCRSQNVASSWAQLSTISDPAVWGRHAQEPCLAYDPGLDRVWCAMRSDTGTFGIYLFYSDDDGGAFTTPGAREFDGSGKPAFLVTDAGIRSIAYRNPAGSTTALRWFDTAWSPIVAVNSGNLYDYASWWELSTGKLGLAWAVEVSANKGSVVYQRMTRPSLISRRPPRSRAPGRPTIAGTGLARSGGGYGI